MHLLRDGVASTCYLWLLQLPSRVSAPNRVNLPVAAVAGRRRAFGMLFQCCLLFNIRYVSRLYVLCFHL